MVAARQIHIVDTDSRRRAALAFKLNGNGHRAHVYENINELGRFEAVDGLVLLSGDDEMLPSELNDGQLSRGNMPVALYSSAPSPSSAVRAMLAGALDHLTWPIDDGALEELLIRADSCQKIMQRRAQAIVSVELLSEREREVLMWMTRGLSNKSIAIQLSISPRTVEVHRSNLLRKLAVESSAGAVRVGIYAGLDDVDPEIAPLRNGTCDGKS